MKTLCLRSPKVFGFLLLATLILSACQSTLTPQKDLHSTLGRFAQALRWGDHGAVASYFVDAEEGRAFIERQRDRGQINVTEVRIVDIVPSDEGLRAEVTLEIEYYELPSASLRRFDTVQHWKAAGIDNTGQGRWLLETPFPPFPGAD
ncbi:hypothetical protein GSUB_01590 [Geoalkalibacter subterraneus]|uniref:Lipoprotein n=1 Tax=Geoalkalibacter subterraneus TaxID=483547 RepID=A0A0B5FLM8_9BACT|nr:hypothetical protein GSUB_01590 [Geoalkalibacter subterraneus]